jgi:hypothetical protein
LWNNSTNLNVPYTWLDLGCTENIYLLSYIIFLQENNIVSCFSGNKFFEKKVHKWQSRKSLSFWWNNRKNDSETNILPRCRIKDISTFLRYFTVFALTVFLYSQTCVNGHLWTTATCQQRPVWSHNGQSEPYLPLIFFRQPSA